MKARPIIERGQYNSLIKDEVNYFAKAAAMSLLSVDELRKTLEHIRMSYVKKYENNND